MSFWVLSLWVFDFCPNWGLEICHNLSFWVSSQFEFINSSQFEFLSFVTVWVLSLITIWVFEFHHNLSCWVFRAKNLMKKKKKIKEKINKNNWKKKFCLCNYVFLVTTVTIVTTVTTITSVKIWVLSFVIIWVCEFGHQVSLWVLSPVEFFLFLSQFEIHHNLSFWVLSQFEFLSFFLS